MNNKDAAEEKAVLNQCPHCGGLYTDQEGVPVTWIRNTPENEPPADGRYAVIYQQKSVVRRFIADYSVTDGWLIGMDDVQILAWWKLPDIPEWVIRQMEEK